MAKADMFSDDVAPSSPIEFFPLPDVSQPKPKKQPPKPMPDFPPGSYTISIHDRENLVHEDASPRPPSALYHLSYKKSTGCTIKRSRSSGTVLNCAVELLDLPVEVIEQIAFSCLDWHPSPLEHAATFVTTGYTSFSSGRFTLSAFSQTSKHIRSIVERVLYREPQLDFTAWKGRKHSRHPAACMKRLLRTLTDRPALGQFIFAVALDYPVNATTEIEQSLETFILMTPKLQTLSIPHWPASFWNMDVSMDRLKAVSAFYIPGFMEAALENMPGLLHIHLRDGPTAVRGMKRDVTHHLETLRIDSCNIDVTFNLGHALKMSSTSVHELDLRFTGSMLDPVPLYVNANWKIHSTWGCNITKLRLDNLSILNAKNIDTSFVEFIGRLPSLIHVHLSHHDIIAPAAFSVLPKTVNLITFSDYFGVWGNATLKDEALFMKRIAQSMEMEMHERNISRVVCWPGISDRFYHLEPIVLLCHREGIPFDVVSGSGDVYIEISFGTFKTPSPPCSTKGVSGENPLNHAKTSIKQGKTPKGTAVGN